MIYTPQKIISSGQTGASIGALVGAKRLQIDHGGISPKGYMTEIGPKETDLRQFGIVSIPTDSETESMRQNISVSNASLIICPRNPCKDSDSAVNLSRKQYKPYLIINKFGIDELLMARDFVDAERPCVLHICGNRNSLCPGIAREVAGFVQALFGDEIPS